MIEIMSAGDTSKTVGEEFAEFRQERRLRQAARALLTRKVRHAVQCGVPKQRRYVDGHAWRCPACGEVVA